MPSPTPSLTALAAILGDVDALLRPLADRLTPPFEDRMADVKIALARVATAREVLRHPTASLDNPVLVQDVLDALTDVLGLTGHATRDNGRGIALWFRNGQGYAVHERVVESLSALWTLKATRPASRAASPVPDRRPQGR